MAKKTNPHRKEARQRRWRAGQERKALRRERDREAAARNRRLRAEGKPTPWEVACARAVARRSGASIGVSSTASVEVSR